jgi:hypothetical protein
MDKFIKNRTNREQQTHTSEQPIAQQQTVEKQKKTVLLSKFELMRKLRFQLRYDYG